MTKLTDSQRYAAKDAAGASIQERVNRLYPQKMGSECLRETLIAIADSRFAEFPQYAGHHDDWFVVQINFMLKTKGGVHTHPGDFVLAKRVKNPESAAFGSIEILSNRTFHHVSTGIVTLFSNKIVMVTAEKA